MKRVCAWCKIDLGLVEEGHETFGVTHGICEKCLKTLLLENSKLLHEFLDSLCVPVVTIGPGLKVRGGNKYARELMGKELSEIEELGPGDIIECVHSHAPGGCGSELHCKSCVIRNTVLETFATGKSFTNVPACPDIEMWGKVKSICFRISTEKFNDLVLLRVDDLKKNESGLP